MQFEIFKKYGNRIKHGMSTRHGGVSSGPYESLNLGLEGDEEANIHENYRRFCEEVGVSVDALCVPYQEHTDKVLIVTEGAGLGSPFSGIDGFITNVPGVPIVVRFADCQGVLMFDPKKGVVAAVHSGWRGNAQNIIGKTVGRLVHEFGCDPKDILVGISASLGPCCAEFTDPKRELPDFMQKYVVGTHVHLWNCSLDQLAEAGVVREHVELVGRCTVCENAEFFSFRGGKGKTGHMAAVICLE